MELSPPGVRKGAWSKEEDELLRKCIETYGVGKWSSVPIRAGLRRCRKSCRLRWLNYLSPSIHRGAFTKDEVDLIIRLHNLLGNRWSLIAGRVPGRTANDIKNFWNSHLSKKADIKNTTQETSNKTTVVRPQPQRPAPGLIRSKSPQIPGTDQLGWFDYPSPSLLDNDQAWANGLLTSNYGDGIDLSFWDFDDGYERQIFEGVDDTFEPCFLKTWSPTYTP